MAKYSELVDDEDLLKLPVVQKPVAPAPAVPTTAAQAGRKYSDIAAEQERLASDVERTAADAEVTRAMGVQVKQDTAERAGEIASDMEQSRQITKQKLDEINARNDELRKKYTQPIVEPDRWKRILSGVVKVIGALGAGSGSGGGAGLAAAMGLIDDKLNEEVTDQLRAKAQTGEQLKLNEGILGEIQAQSKSELERDTMTANAIYKEGAEQFEAYAEQASSAEEALKYRKVASELRSKADEIVVEGFKFQQAMKPKAVAAKSVPIDQVIDSMSMEQLQQSAATPGPYQVKAIERLQKIVPATSDKKAPAPAGATVVDPGLWASVPDTEKAKYRLGKSALEAYNRDSARLQKLLEEHGTEAISLSPWSNVKAEMEALHASLLGSYKEIKELGALDTGVIQLTDRAHGDPTAWFTGGGASIARLKATRESLNEGFRAREAGLGLAPASKRDDQSSSGGSPGGFQPGSFNRPPSSGASDARRSSGRRGGSF